MDNKEEPDFDFEDEEESETPDYYACHSCMRYYGKKPTWGQCDICGSYVEEGFY